MSLVDLSPATERRFMAGSAVLVAFTAAIFTSAFLLFAIQPMFARMVLPQLGGSPAVWSVAMVVFQGLLLAGYGYAHVLTKRLSPRHAAGLHLAMLALTALTLPIGVSGALGAPPNEGQALWLVGLFLLSVGLPFFALAGNGPLLQAWFARSGHRLAHDPYFLYGASNLGSFAALLLYPVLFEPLLPLRAQATSWSLGFVVLVGLIALSALPMRQVTTREASVAAGQGEPVSLNQIALWVFLSFIPSGLLVAVTAHISTDVAAAPFMWVIPLALFLLTFTLTFREKPLAPMETLRRLLPVGAVVVAVVATFLPNKLIPILVTHIGFFLMATLVCHDRLYRARPAPAQLTSFYLWMSFGGVLGGLFTGLISPFVFDRIIEYPLLVVLALLVLPLPPRQRLIGGLLAALVLTGAVFAAITTANAGYWQAPHTTRLVLLMATMIGTLALYRRPLLAAAALPALFMLNDFVWREAGERLFDRSFFGVHKVQTLEEGRFRVLMHGTTIHGAVRIRNDDGTPYEGPVVPLTYYHPEGAMASTLAALPARAQGRRIGLVGLGSGAFACNARPEDKQTYFEIDSAVVRLAQDATLFPFLARCAPHARMVVGDARLTLVNEPTAGLDYLLIDAFSSDAIPTHLMTREAMALYLEKLAPEGMLVMHISNRHLELESVVAALAREQGLQIRVRFDPAPKSVSLAVPLRSRVVALSRSPETIGRLATDPRWAHPRDLGGGGWSDDYSNLLGALWRNYRH